jgi:hypothetical protein
MNEVNQIVNEIKANHGDNLTEKDFIKYAVAIMTKGRKTKYLHLEHEIDNLSDAVTLYMKG